MSALITGINGFVGSHLAEFLLARGDTVHGLVRHPRSDLTNIAPLLGRVHLHYADLTDAHGLRAAVRSAAPDLVFHLAAQSYVPASWANPYATLAANVTGTLHLLEALRAEGKPGVRVQVAGSSEEYGKVLAHECPITEDQPLRPMSPYGVSKAACDLLARQYATSYPLHVVVTRAFNHSGPRRGSCFAESEWAMRIARIELGLEGHAEIRHGNLNAVRDYTHVRDIVRGYVMAAERGERGAVYQFCTGDGWTMREVLEALLRMSTNAEIRLSEDPARMRPSDVELLKGTAAKAEREFGWKPELTVKDMLRDLLDYWRATLGNGREKMMAV